MANILEVIPAVVRAEVGVADMNIRGSGFVSELPIALRFVSSDGAVLLNAAQFTVHSDGIISIPLVEFPAIGTYRLQVEGRLGLLAQMDGAVVVNTPPISFTVEPNEATVNTVVDDITLTLTGVASAQVALVRISGTSTMDIDEFERPDRKTIRFFPLSFSFLGEHSIQLFEDTAATMPLGDPLEAAIEVVEADLSPDISGLSQILSQPGDLIEDLRVQGTGFSLDDIEVLRIQSDGEVFTFTPQLPPFTPETAIPAGEFRLLSATELQVADFTPTVPGEFGAFLQKTISGNPAFIASRNKALTVEDTRKPAVTFDPDPGKYELEQEVTLTAEFTDPNTGLPTGVEDTGSTIYFLVTPLNQFAAEEGVFAQVLRTPDPLTQTDEDFNPPQVPQVTPSMLYTGPFDVATPSLVQAIAVDEADNISDVFRVIYDIRNHADRVFLRGLDLPRNYIRYGNVNHLVRNMRIRYNAILEEEDIPGVTQTAPGYLAAETTLLRDLRRGLVDILQDSGQALDEVLTPPDVEFVSDLALKLTPGREIFADSPFPYSPGDNTHRVTRRAEEFGFDATPADGTYEVLLIPSYSDHSFLDPFIRLQGSGDLPDDLPSSTTVPKPIDIFVVAATFDVVAGVIDSSTISNVAGRTTVNQFTDARLDRLSQRLAKDIHYRELEIALEFVSLPQNFVTTSGDTGQRVGDPNVQETIADDPSLPKTYLPPSNRADELQSDYEVVLAKAVGDTPRGPRTASLQQTIRILGTGDITLRHSAGIQVFYSPWFYGTFFGGSVLIWDALNEDGDIEIDGPKDPSFIVYQPPSNQVSKAIFGSPEGGRQSLAPGTSAKEAGATLLRNIPASYSFKRHSVYGGEVVSFETDLSKFKTEFLVAPDFTGGLRNEPVPATAVDGKITADFRSGTIYNPNPGLSALWWYNRADAAIHGWGAARPLIGFFKVFTDGSLIFEDTVEGVSRGYSITVDFDPDAGATANYYEFGPVSGYDYKTGQYRLQIDANTDLDINLFNFRTRTWLSMEESQKAWPREDVVLSAYWRDRYEDVIAEEGIEFETLSGSQYGNLVWIRTRLKAGVVPGDVENVNFQLFLNGKGAAITR